MNEVILIVSRWFHVLGAVIWIGAMILLLLVIIPGVREVFGSAPEAKKLLGSVGRRITALVNAAIVMVVVSGLLLVLYGSDAESNQLSPALTMKVALTSAMIEIHLLRTVIVAPILRRGLPDGPPQRSITALQRIQSNLVWVNLSLGMVVMVMSATLRI
jgi:uncharacterized membrane protein